MQSKLSKIALEQHKVNHKKKKSQLTGNLGHPSNFHEGFKWIDVGILKKKVFEFNVREFSKSSFRDFCHILNLV